MSAAAAIAAAAPANITARQGALPGATFYGVWASTHFESTIPNGGAQVVFQQGFTLIDSDGDIIYEGANPGNYAPCNTFQQGFTVSGSCLSTPITFHCASKPASGTPDRCAAWLSDDPNANETPPTDCEAGNSDVYNNFLSAGLNGGCAVSFYTIADCGADAGLTVETIGDLNLPDIDTCPGDS
ncbi:uncharacterized protein LTR77_003397 [Saxophila tyrrhenica]|uniref:Uncharacterized protein n=1 Tax=Saxophila tyrrhenica TaxID=1690608 RepID=A0AAV9PGH3_9PEZI|nr:hypothetical protein LTR77_003397 [Saxophila tyrrhenica]